MDAMTLSSDEEKQQLAAAVRSLEETTAAEVVIAVHSTSSSHDGIDAFAGWLGGSALLCFMLYADTVFSLWAIALFTPLSAIAFGLMFRSSGALRLRLVPRAHLAKKVGLAARAGFYDLGVSRTRERLGILLHVSLEERVALLIPDCGIQEHIPSEALAKVQSRFRDVLVEHEDSNPTDALTARIKELAALLATHLPADKDNENELADVA